MTLPVEKQVGFVKWFKEIAGPNLGKFGAVKHELYKVEGEEIVGRQTKETDRFIERVYFEDNFDIPSYFAGVKANLKARRLSRMYEEEFRAKDIELRVLVEAI